jgi:hypothetical protein
MLGTVATLAIVSHSRGRNIRPPTQHDAEKRRFDGRHVTKSEWACLD